MDTTGCFVGDELTSIETFSGLSFPLNRIEPDLINLNDIAHALAHTCRLAGHCRRFYSVAEHSVRAYWLAKKDGIVHRLDLRAVLVHDAAEAYIGDMTRPLKVLVPQFREIERKLQAAIYSWFACVPSVEFATEIKRIDNEVLRVEARELMQSRGAAWNFGDVADRDIADFGALGWSPGIAEQMFLDAYDQVS